MPRETAPWRLIELALITAAFGSVYGIYLGYFNDGLPLDRTLAGCVVYTLAFWLASQLKSSSENENPGGLQRSRQDYTAVLIEQFCFGSGLSLLAHALITYSLLARRTPFLVMGGSLLSAIAVTFCREFRNAGRAPQQRKLLLVGFDELASRLLPLLDTKVAGVCGPCNQALPEDLRHLGDLGDFQRIIAQHRPTDILISMPGWDKMLPSGELLKLRLQGTSITEASALYESLYARICCERLQPVHLVLSSALRGDSRTMAIQAVYNNLIGLFLLTLLAPAFLAITLVSAFSSGPGPSIESIECAGFQYIPFRLQRFRTTGRDGNPTALGRVLKRLHLVNLPQLINVVRGDMALVGPRPVRSEFAHYLSATMPFYAHRFSVKPGLVGWAQVHLSPAEARDTRREIEYDLYYIKASSLWLDLEILLEQLPRGSAPCQGSPEREAA